MVELSPAELTQRIVEVGLLEPIEVERAWAEVGASDGSCDDLIQVLLRKQLLTNLQVERLLKGERTGYFYGKWKVLYLIGAGTFARVYRAVHRENGTVAAVKVLRKRHRTERAQVEQFLREARVGMRLRHRNIVAVLEVDADPRSPYMVMEFVEGQTLRELLQVRKKLTPTETLRIMIDVVSALVYAASQGVTHRDMKLSNVLISSQGVAKLVDFGLAALKDTDTDEDLVDCPNARAIDYAALERGTGVRNGDPRSDLYFVGAMMYHCLTGTSPLTETRDRLARLNVTRFHQVPPLLEVAPDVPPNVAAVVHKAMQFKPEKRYQTPQELLIDLKATLASLEKGETEAAPTIAAGNAASKETEDVEQEGTGKTVMLVESKIEFQDVIREKLKKRGYRVLVISDPERALERFDPEEDQPPADVVIFSAPELGAAALEAFNKFGETPHTANIPAVLLVDRKQQFIIRNAKTSPHRIMLAMPLKVRELRKALLMLTQRADSTTSSVSDK